MVIKPEKESTLKTLKREITNTLKNIVENNIERNMREDSVKLGGLNYLIIKQSYKYGSI